MKKWLWMLLVCGGLFAQEEATNEIKFTKDEMEAVVEEKPIVLVVASYNNSAFWRKNIESALAQNYRNFRIIFTNDGSTDGTGQMVQEYMEEHRGDIHFTYLDNKTKKKGSAFNVDRMIRMCEPEEIVCIYDGDDAFVDANVLQWINRAYHRENIWMTYGQFRTRFRNGSARAMPTKALQDGQHRKLPWKTFGLRNFYAGLYLSIPREKWMYKGDFIPVAHDVLQMYYLMDRAREHVGFINKPFLFYNLDTGNNDSGIRRKEQVQFENLIRDTYPPLEKLTSKEEMFIH
ncbi:glycosyltransferase [bacterium]|nr:glycosyltransferase [bacterium]